MMLGSVFLDVAVIRQKIAEFTFPFYQRTAYSGVVYE